MWRSFLSYLILTIAIFRWGNWSLITCANYKALYVALLRLEARSVPQMLLLAWNHATRSVWRLSHLNLPLGICFLVGEQEKKMTTTMCAPEYIDVITLSLTHVRYTCRSSLFFVARYVFVYGLLKQHHVLGWRKSKNAHSFPYFIPWLLCAVPNIMFLIPIPTHSKVSSAFCSFHLEKNVLEWILTVLSWEHLLGR